MSIAAANPTQYRASFSSGNNAVQQVHLPKIVHSGARTGDPTALNMTKILKLRMAFLNIIFYKMKND